MSHFLLLKLSGRHYIISHVCKNRTSVKLVQILNATAEENRVETAKGGGGSRVQSAHTYGQHFPRLHRAAELQSLTRGGREAREGTSLTSRMIH